MAISSRSFRSKNTILTIHPKEAIPMKRIPVLFLVCLLSVIVVNTAIAQHGVTDTHKRSSFSLGLGLDMGAMFSALTTTAASPNLRLQPRYTYAISRQLSIGGMLDYDYNGSEFASLTKLSVGPQVVYYFMVDANNAGKFQPYLTGGIQHLWYQQSEFSTPVSRARFLTGYAGVGTKYFIFEKAGLFFEVGYEAGYKLDGNASFNGRANQMKSAFGLTFSW